jgi:AcrR family transcriptional regulator
MPRPNRWPEIVSAASEEFRSRGYDSATLEDIGARVGILKGSIYNYVSSKEELLLAVVEKPARALLAELDDLRADRTSTVTMRLRKLFRVQIRIFSEYYPSAFVYLRNIGPPTLSAKFVEFQDMDGRYMRAVEELIAEGSANGEFTLPAPPRTVARAIVGMLDWMQHWFTPRGAEQDQELADDMFALALGGLAAGGSLRRMARAFDEFSAPEREFSTAEEHGA